MEYDGAAEKFSFSSGTTGDTSEISIDFNTNAAGVITKADGQDEFDVPAFVAAHKK